ncbi:MAG TPA: hypothetical protein VD886_14215 [Herpetosiphonaceae bacterium]|nr:hypothetical protein [Herpetosiphonaceae bacterium]
MPLLLFGCLVWIARGLARLFVDIPRAINAAIFGVTRRSEIRSPART